MDTPSSDEVRTLRAKYGSVSPFIKSISPTVPDRMGGIQSPDVGLEIRRLKSEVQKQTERADEAEKKIRELYIELNNLREEKERERRENRELLLEKGREMDRADEAEKKMREIHSELTDLREEREKETLAHRESVSARKISTLQSDLDDYKRQYRILETELREKKRELSEVENPSLYIQEKSMLQAEIENYKKDKTYYQAQIQKQSLELTHLRKQLEDEKTRLSHDLKELRADKSELSIARDMLLNQQKEHIKKISDLLDQLSSQRTKSEISEGMKESMKKTMDMMEEKCKQMKEEYKEKSIKMSQEFETSKAHLNSQYHSLKLRLEQECRKERERNEELTLHLREKEEKCCSLGLEIKELKAALEAVQRSKESFEAALMEGKPADQHELVRLMSEAKKAKDSSSCIAQKFSSLEEKHQKFVDEMKVQNEMYIALSSQTPHKYLMSIISKKDEEMRDLHEEIKTLKAHKERLKQQLITCSEFIQSMKRKRKAKKTVHLLIKK
ncbi:hypothetical protein ADUPG1_009953 [Aduncisulcus paluster]|uniref:Uncharacterized protein n=1 Tax=Aduncisulcus paluster TaxID=2918883 RepID=A0ABQ5KXC9_9EUKA|nr:hypothetical protein ADUPG1_009953 [Aduncisulcus paluster]